MTDAQEFILSTYIPIRNLSNNSVNAVDLVRSKIDQKLYIIRRIHKNKTALYEEIQTLASPFIPQIHSVIYDSDTIIIEDFVEGTLLSECILSKIPLNDILLSLLSALSMIHSNHIIHRDIKAENILITASSTPILLDFAIAKLSYDFSCPDTDVLGTIGNAPPEQFGIAPTDPRSDYYSFGRMVQDC